MEEDMEEQKTYLRYCPICGGIGQVGCNDERHGEAIEIDPKWDITSQKFMEMFALCQRHEITYRQFWEKWNEYCEPFLNAVVFQNLQFNKEEYQKLIKEREQDIQHQEELTRKWEAEHSQPSAPAKPVITCPYCKSTNTKKLSSLSRALSAGLFGLGSSKIGKQWHCNSCGSDF